MRATPGRPLDGRASTSDRPLRVDHAVFPKSSGCRSGVARSCEAGRPDTSPSGRTGSHRGRPRGPRRRRRPEAVVALRVRAGRQTRRGLGPLVRRRAHPPVLGVWVLGCAGSLIGGVAPDSSPPAPSVRLRHRMRRASLLLGLRHCCCFHARGQHAKTTGRRRSFAIAGVEEVGPASGARRAARFHRGRQRGPPGGGRSLSPKSTRACPIANRRRVCNVVGLGSPPTDRFMPSRRRAFDLLGHGRARQYRLGAHNIVRFAKS